MPEAAKVVAAPSSVSSSHEALIVKRSESEKTVLCAPPPPRDEELDLTTSHHPLEQELTCAVCHQFYERPVLLKCGHHVCLKHIDCNHNSTSSNADGNNNNNNNINNNNANNSLIEMNCPICNTPTSFGTELLPLHMNNVLAAIVDQYKASIARDTGGAASLLLLCGVCEEAVSTKACRECNANFCDTCCKTTHAKGFFKNHTISDLLVEEEEEEEEKCHQHAKKDRKSELLVNLEGPVYCPEHTEERLNLYCIDCRHPVCSHCLLFGDHKHHTKTTIAEASQQGLGTMADWNLVLQRRRTDVHEFLTELKQLEKDVTTNAESTRECVMQEITALEEQLAIKKSQLLKKVDGDLDRKMNYLQNQISNCDGQLKHIDAVTARQDAVSRLQSDYSFLAFCLPVIQDIKLSVLSEFENTACIDARFPSFSTGMVYRAVSELDLLEPPTLGPVSVHRSAADGSSPSPVKPYFSAPQAQPQPQPQHMPTQQNHPTQQQLPAHPNFPARCFEHGVNNGAVVRLQQGGLPQPVMYVPAQPVLLPYDPPSSVGSNEFRPYHQLPMIPAHFAAAKQQHHHPPPEGVLRQQQQVGSSSTISSHHLVIGGGQTPQPVMPPARSQNTNHASNSNSNNNNNNGSSSMQSSSNNVGGSVNFMAASGGVASGVSSVIGNVYSQLSSLSQQAGQDLVKSYSHAGGGSASGEGHPPPPQQGFGDGDDTPAQPVDK